MYTRVVSIGGGGGGLFKVWWWWREGVESIHERMEGGDSLERTRTRLLVTFGLKIDKNAVINIGSTQ